MESGLRCGRLSVFCSLVLLADKRDTRLSEPNLNLRPMVATLIR